MHLSNVEQAQAVEQRRPGVAWPAVKMEELQKAAPVGMPVLGQIHDVGNPASFFANIIGMASQKIAGHEAAELSRRALHIVSTIQAPDLVEYRLAVDPVQKSGHDAGTGLADGMPPIPEPDATSGLAVDGIEQLLALLRGQATKLVQSDLRLPLASTKACP